MKINDYFINMARTTSERSSCCRAKVGCVLTTRSGFVISTGYNGTPSGVENCDKGGCIRCNSRVITPGDYEKCICVHAEQNAIAIAARLGAVTNDSIAYTTIIPCLKCLTLLRQAGAFQIVHSSDGVERVFDGQHSLMLRYFMVIEV